MRPSPEQQHGITSRESSRAFIEKWDKRINTAMFTVMAANFGVNSFMTGLSLSMGNEKQALFHGLAAGAFGAITVLGGIGMSREPRMSGRRIHIDKESKQ